MKPLHEEAVAVLAVPPETAFALLDDFRAMSAHMERPSAMMLGSRMRIATDALDGRAVGSRVRMEGRILGMKLHLEEIVTERAPPARKAWKTTSARLLVIGQYTLGFELSPLPSGSRLRVFIDYELPGSWPARWIGLLLGHAYARWCTRRMAGDAVARFGTP